jgi:glycosyltransferase involved in cell wall biosynthesis
MNSLPPSSRPARILVAPHPSNKSSVGIYVKRLVKAIRAENIYCTSLSRRILGFSPFRDDMAIVIGAPVNFVRILESGKPSVLLLGKPETALELKAVGQDFGPAHQNVNLQLMRALTLCNRVAFISNYVKEIWRSHNLGTKEMERVDAAPVIYHGLDLATFSPWQKHQLNGEPLIIGSFGAFRTIVRIDAVYEVSRRLPFEHRIILVGSFTPECEARLTNLSADSVFRRRLTKIGWVKEDHLPALYNSIDILLHPVDYEGFGIVIAEAMACGVPVVAPRHGGAGEIIREGGITVCTEQYKYGADFMDQLAHGVICASQSLSTFGSRARHLAESNFDIRKNVHQFIKVAYN